MKTWIIFFSLLCGYSSTNSQPIIEENFIYQAGILTQVSSSWFEEPLGSNDIQVKEGSLSYPGYPSSGAGNMIFLDGGFSGLSGVKRTFTSISGNGKRVFLSFLLNLSDTLDILSTTNFCRLKQDQMSCLLIYLQKVTGTGKYRIGLSKSGVSPIYDPLLRNPGETYLITALYQFNTGYDTLKLWINPDLSGGIPAPNLVYCQNTLDAGSINTLNFVPSVTSGNEYIDGIRVDTSWAQSPLPVELSSFTAEMVNDIALLKWKTETEVDNYGFDLEKITDAAGDVWKKICFIEGHGNCNTPQSYSWTDKNIYNYSSSLYRLKQIDNDGSFSYSNEITFTPELPGDIYLYQNYPNPFNSSTQIRYKVPAGETGDVEMKLYNVLGNEVSLLVNERKNPGLYEISFDSGVLNLSAGIYFYSLSINYDRTKALFQVKKLLLLK